ncbi:MAG: flagellar motor protein MotB [Elusimicrobia bacterium]|nr:flagellar motor protein MotB [Elusimicrobiota bacterium]
MRRYGILILAGVLGGCVSASKFQAQEAESRSQRGRAETAEAEASALKGLLEASRKAEQELKTQLEAQQKTNKDLQESLEANKSELVKKVAELIKERDAREAETAALKNQLAEIERARTAELDQVKKNYEELTAGLKSEIAAGEIKITELRGRLTVNMVDRILFDSGQAEVKPAGRKVLEKVGSLLNSVKDKDIRIEGHTDNVPIGGELKSRYPSNWDLSTARATAVARYLEDFAKVDPKRLVATGYGEWRPVAANDTLDNKALNRRIEIVLVPRD